MAQAIESQVKGTVNLKMFTPELELLLTISKAGSEVSARYCADFHGEKDLAYVEGLINKLYGHKLISRRHVGSVSRLGRPVGRRVYVYKLTDKGILVLSNLRAQLDRGLRTKRYIADGSQGEPKFWYDAQM